MDISSSISAGGGSFNIRMISLDAKATSVGISFNSGGGSVNMWMITLEFNMRMITLDTKASSVGIYILLSVWEVGHLT